MKVKDSASTKDSRSSVLSTEQRLRNYQELYKEIKHLYEVNKEIFKINIGSSENDGFSKVVSVLMTENKFLYEAIVRHFTQSTPDKGFESMPSCSFSTSSNRKCGGDCQKLVKRLQQKVELLEKDVSAKKEESSKAHFVAAKNQGSSFTKDNLRFLKDKKLLEQKLVCTEMRLNKIIQIKNELLRQNFVRSKGN